MNDWVCNTANSYYFCRWWRYILRPWMVCAVVSAIASAATPPVSRHSSTRLFLDSSAFLAAAHYTNVQRKWSSQTRMNMGTNRNPEDLSGMPVSEESTAPPLPIEGSKDPVETVPKVHHMTVCMVPPPHADHVWKVVSEMRRQLHDPGYYRWPPHANLLYPFLDIHKGETILAVLDRLHSATQKIEQFPVKLRRLGTFGGNRRGVLWLSPDSSGPDNPESANNNNDNDNDVDDCTIRHPPLIQLHQHLEQAFPMCQDQTKGGSFTPHMTLSHFETLESALAAQVEIERDYADDLATLEFAVDRIYLLRRQGDGGQFLRVADIGLGKDGVVERWDPPIPFPFMPTEEEDWVHQERMKLKSRRNNPSSGWKRRGGARRSLTSTTRRREPRVPDTPEVIAAKRAERQAKRERLEREQQY